MENLKFTAAAWIISKATNWKKSAATVTRPLQGQSCINTEVSFKLFALDKLIVYLIHSLINPWWADRLPPFSYLKFKKFFETVSVCFYSAPSDKSGEYQNMFKRLFNIDWLSYNTWTFAISIYCMCAVIIKLPLYPCEIYFICCPVPLVVYYCILITSMHVILSSSSLGWLYRGENSLSLLSLLHVLIWILVKGQPEKENVAQGPFCHPLHFHMHI